MATRSERYPRRFLIAEDLKGRSVVVEIEEECPEELTDTNGKTANKPVLSFVGKEKKLVLNATNWDSIVEITGCEDSRDWPGHKVELFPTTTPVAGRHGEIEATPDLRGLNNFPNSMNIHSLSMTAAAADNPNLTAALSPAAAGLPVFPAGPDKRPLLAGWQEKASTEEEHIRKWWDSHPTALPAIVVGRAGLVVIDCDRHPGGNDGIKAFNELVSANGAKLANVPMTRTARGGAHLFFRQPSGEPLGNARGGLPDASMCAAWAALSLHQVQCCRTGSSGSPSMAGRCWPMPSRPAAYPNCRSG